MILARTFSILFLVVICVPGLGLFFLPTLKIDPIENRTLAPFPSSFQADDFREQLTRYVNDHFGFRHELISAQCALLMTLFGNLSADDSHPDVLIGQNHWLYYLGDGTLDDLQGNGDFPPELIANFISMIKARAAICEKAGAPYLFVMPPDKQSIYPEHLPFGAAYPDRITRLSKLKTKLILDPVANADFLDLAPVLLEKKSPDRSLFFLTDTHWNRWGAYVAYTGIMNRLREDKKLQLRQLELKPSDFQGKVVPTDLARMAHIQFDDIDYRPVSGMFAPDTVTNIDFPPQWLGSFAHSGMEAPLKYSGTMVNPKAPNPQTVLFFGDSFAYGMMLFFQDTFQKVIYLNTFPDDDMFAKCVDGLKPDIVIEERVERHLSLLDFPISESTRTMVAMLNSGQWNLEAEANGTPAIQQAGGKIPIPVLTKTPPAGHIDHFELDSTSQAVVIRGWAGCQETGLPYDAILVFEGPRLLAAGYTGKLRPEVAKDTGIPGFARSGYLIKIPVSAFTKESSPQPLRLFGIIGGPDPNHCRAQELPINPQVIPSELSLGSVTAIPTPDGIKLQ